MICREDLSSQVVRLRQIFDRACGRGQVPCILLSRSPGSLMHMEVIIRGELSSGSFSFSDLVEVQLTMENIMESYL